MSETSAAANGVTARYVETDAERCLVFELGEDEGTDVSLSAAVTQNVDGYAMLSVQAGGPDGDEVERYYGLEMALDHAAELLGVPSGDLPVPPAARDMGM